MSYGLLAYHLSAALRTLFLIAGRAHRVRLPVPATGADAVAARPGGLGATHPAWPASAAAPSATTATATSSTIPTHVTHLLSLPAPTRISFRAGRCGAALLLTAAGMSRLPGRLPAQHERDRKHLVQRRITTMGTDNSIARPYQHLKRRATVATAIFIDRHRTLLVPLRTGQPPPADA